MAAERQVSEAAPRSQVLQAVLARHWSVSTPVCILIGPPATNSPQKLVELDAAAQSVLNLNENCYGGLPGLICMFSLATRVCKH